ncbi:MAG: SUMF1/EgtB/PvdO family nonheme iron enzyme, partial [Acidobacteria bacterium]|nr:SUMF1/EgtB/PvdO family nonheme iron enzyme [Acidobacteriota bacterium]
MPQPARVFVSYSHEDDRYRVALTRHLRLLERQGLIESWFDRKILPGEALDAAIQRELERAEVVLFLVSADFLASEYCYGVEMKRATERYEAGEALVVTLIVRACDWHSSPFGKLLALPTDGKPVTSWDNPDEAWTDVARGLRRLLETRQGRAPRAAAAPGKAPDPRRYLEALDSHCSWIKLQGMGAKVAELLPLDRVYTRLRVRSARAGNLGEKGKKARMEEELLRGETSASLAEVLRDHPSAVLVGDPGSGKTTFLKFAAQKLARDLLGAEKGAAKAQLGIAGDAPFPILLRLSELAEFLVANPEHGYPPNATEHLLRFLDYTLRGAAHGLPQTYLRDRLVEGGCFLLLDGLDEVPAASRGRIAALIDQAVAELRGENRFLLTCRTRAYEGKACLGTLESFTLADFGPQEVESFVRGWCRALHHVDSEEPASAAARDAEAYWGQLQEALDAHPNVGPLTRNPLMLTMLAVVHWSHHKLPEQRAELYKVAVEYLLDSRAEQAKEKGYTPQLRQEALQALALAMFEDEEGLQRSYGLESAADAIREVLAVEERLAALDFLEEETVHSGLLVSHTEGEVEFWHLTFQEYLTALELAASGDWRHLAEERLFADQWNEVVLLLGGCLRRNNGVRGAKKLVEKVLATGRDLPTKARAVGLAGRILRDVRPYGGDPAAGTAFETLLEETLAIFRPPAEEGAPIAPESLRVEVGEALGQAGDPRLEDEESLWVDLPGGTFLMGAQREDSEAPGYDAEAFDAEAPVRRITLSPFRIGRYPVTVGLFRRFVEARHVGYLDPRYWDPKGWAWRENEELVAPDGWLDQLRHPNRPVTGVSWYEADAYCRWRGGRLPTDAQWEYAARGEEGRKYPWGKAEPTDSHACFDYRIGYAPPVGVYPLGATPDGLHDLAGGVWEWCQ